MIESQLPDQVVNQTASTTIDWPHIYDLDLIAALVSSSPLANKPFIYLNKNSSNYPGLAPKPMSNRPYRRIQYLLSYFAWLQSDDCTAADLRRRIREHKFANTILVCNCGSTHDVSNWWIDPCPAYIIAALTLGLSDLTKLWIKDLEILLLGLLKSGFDVDGAQEQISYPQQKSSTPKFSKTGLAIDGNNLLHRAFHVRPENPNPLFISLLKKACAIVNPNYLVVCFDGPNNKRKARYPAYKAGRTPKPPQLIKVLKELPKCLADAGIATYIPTGYEADDALASFSKSWCSVGTKAVLHSSDRDLLATITSSSSVLRPGDVSFVSPDYMFTKYGVTASQYLDFAALRGDKSDNLPGVPGIGPKKAAQVVNIASLADHFTDNYARVPDPLRELLVLHHDQLLLTLDLMTLQENLPVDTTLGDRSLLIRHDLEKIFGSGAKSLATT